MVTGVRRRGIGFAVAQRLLRDGFRVLVHSYGPGDKGPVGEEGDKGPVGEEMVRELGAEPGAVAHLELDLGEAEAPRELVERTLAEFGALDVLVACHAHGSDQSLAAVEVAELDRAWAVNARAPILLAQAFAECHDDRPDGRVVLFTSGQHLGPMPGELPYVLSKGAVHQVTATLADELADRGITVNAINPGPVDTGWPSPAQRERLARAFPAGRWGEPGDIAAVVAWLASAESAWLTGQVIDVEGGFRRSLAGA